MEQAFRHFSRDEAAIFNAHLMILEDPELIERSEKDCEWRCHSSNAASQVIEGYVGIFQRWKTNTCGSAPRYQGCGKPADQKPAGDEDAILEAWMRCNHCSPRPDPSDRRK
jgi:hypothetical protein